MPNAISLELHRIDVISGDSLSRWLTGTFRAGLRPMTPSSVPILGPARYRNFFLNVGHGHVGWTMSCGSAKFVADCLAGRSPEIDGAGLLYG